MRIRWTPAAADDLENIANYLLEKAPVNAAKLIREIYSMPSSLHWCNAYKDLLANPLVYSKTDQRDGSDYLHPLHQDYKLVYRVQPEF